MMPDFQADLDDLMRAGGSWGDVGDHLATASNGAQNIHDAYANSGIKWALFQQAWDAQQQAAIYVRDRLAEGRDSARDIRDILFHVAKVYADQDSRFADAILKLEAGS
ncbi:hypothetical protein [Nocardia sp. alder85J]|uniref:hypothetical protein n=1 Tax=Nocardia sp. alder85J TaxID=2862949 RepID=UPI001CD5F53E|nr:hypothetical protein [Nocardia sp. alder85J]MCX4092072.1 hypothetical protein [Nocardia sp. alder85J]